MSVVYLHSPKEQYLARKAGKLAAELLNYIEPLVKPGVSTKELNDEAERWTASKGALSAPLGYVSGDASPFPFSICTSINEVICHGKPNDEPLKDGDIINVDVTPKLNGWHGDTSRTFLVGECSDLAKRLVQTTKECLDLGIQQARPGKTLGDIGSVIQTHAKRAGFSVVRMFVGHGTGRIFHCAPQVPHYGVSKAGLELRPGMIFTIEPMVNEGSPGVKMIDEWIAETIDGKLSAQFEHTILITEGEAEVLTAI